MDGHPRWLRPKVGVAALSSALEVGADRAEEVAAEFASALGGWGCEVVALGAIQSSSAAQAAGERLHHERADALLAIPVSWYEDYLTVDLLEEWSCPLFLWPLPGVETGALCGAQQNLCMLRRLGRQAEAAFGPIGDAGCRRKAVPFLRAAALRNAMRRSRIGLAGSHVNGMTHCAPDEFQLKRQVGPRVVHLDLDELAKDLRPGAADAAAWDALSNKAGACLAADADGQHSMRWYHLLKKTAETERLDVLAVGCYPKLMGEVCLAASLLADDGIPLACEGDVNGAAAMLALSRLSGGAVHNTDWLEPVGDDRILFSHCGSGSFSLAESQESISLAPVRLMSRGVCARFPARPGPVTLLNLTPGEGGYICAVLEGEAVSGGMLFPGNPLQASFARPAAELVDWVFKMGLGHHWMAAPGSFGPELRRWAALSGLSLADPVDVPISHA